MARAGLASRRHAEQLILSGQVRVNGEVVRELGSKADAAQDRIEVAGRKVRAEERRVYLALNKPPEIVSSLADPEGRRTLRNLLRGFPERVYPVGNLEYSDSGLVFLTNDGELAAALLRNWGQLEQVYHFKVKGMLSRGDLERLGRETGVRMETLKQPDAARGHSANYWYETRLRSAQKEALKNLLFREGHPVEKAKRTALSGLTLEGIPRGRYRPLREGEIALLRKSASRPRRKGR